MASRLLSRILKGARSPLATWRWLVRKREERRDNLILRTIAKTPIYKAIDVVDFGEVACFMFEGDNLYEDHLPAEVKRADLKAIAQSVNSGQINERVPSLAAIAVSTDPRHLFFAILAHVWDSGREVTVLDVGAHTGLVGLRMARFSAAQGRDIKVVAFEPGSMEELARRNVELNDLGKWMSVTSDAVADYNGLAVLHFQKASSDGDNLIDRPDMAMSKIVRTRRISNVVALEGADRVIFAKLDTEGLEPALIADMLALSGQWTFCIAFEFMPHRYGANVAIELLRTLDKDFAIFEIGYTPNPSSARQVPAIGFESFIADVVKQPWGYVDVLAISRRMPNFDALAARLAKFESRPITFKMVSPKD